MTPSAGTVATPVPTFAPGSIRSAPGFQAEPPPPPSTAGRTEGTRPLPSSPPAQISERNCKMQNSKTFFQEDYKSGIYNEESVDRIFKDDCAEKKRTGTGAFHMNRNKNLFAETKPEPEPCYTWKREPMTWLQFKEMPDMARKGYLDFLVKELKADRAKISRMFGVSLSTVTNEGKRVGFRFPMRTVYNIEEMRKADEDFKAWLRSFDFQLNTETVPAEPKEPKETPKPTKTEPAEESVTLPLSQIKGKVTVKMELPGGAKLSIIIGEE